jgi:hypothetical protein
MTPRPDQAPGPRRPTAAENRQVVRDLLAAKQPQYAALLAAIERQIGTTPGGARIDVGATRLTMAAAL